MRMGYVIRNILLFLLFFISLWPYHYVQGVPEIHIPISVVHFFPEWLIIGLSIWCYFYKRQNMAYLDWVCVVFFLWVLLGSIGGTYIGAYTARAINYFGMSLLLGWVTSIYINRLRDIHVFVCAISIIVILISGYGILEFAIKRNLLFERLFSPENPIFFRFLRGNVNNQFRVYGTLGSPVYFGTFLMVCLPCCWYLLFYGHKRAIQLMGGLSVLMGHVALLFTFSRGAWLGAGVSVVIFLFFRKIQVKTLMVWAGVVGVSLITIGVGTEFGRFAVDRGLFDEFRQYQSHGRTLAYLQSTQMATISPFVGNGVGSYRSLASQFGDDDHTPDNMYLRLFVETGFGGLVVFVLFYLQILTLLLAQIRKSARLDSLDQKIALILFMSLCGFAVNLFFCDALYFPPTRILFWIFIGICFGFLKRRKMVGISGVLV